MILDSRTLSQGVFHPLFLGYIAYLIVNDKTKEKPLLLTEKKNRTIDHLHIINSKKCV